MDQYIDFQKKAPPKFFSHFKKVTNCYGWHRNMKFYNSRIFEAKLKASGFSEYSSLEGTVAESFMLKKSYMSYQCQVSNTWNIPFM